MNVHVKRYLGAAVLAAAVAVVALPYAAADEKPVTVKVSAKAVSGAAVEVPALDRPTVLLFVRADQPQSHQALRQVGTVVKEPTTAQVALVLSGEQAPQHARGLAEGYDYPWPIVIDADYAISGAANVHVWPTTVVVDAKGNRVAHLPGLNKSYSTNLEAHLDLAAGRIDQAALKEKLATHHLIGDSPDQAAARHVQVAQRLMEKDRRDEAGAELAVAMKLGPKDSAVQLTMARMFLQLDQPLEALTLLERLPKSPAPDADVELLRARALVSREKWQQAKEILPTLLKLRPKSGEVHYLMGLVHQQDKDHAKAAEEFRLAFEASSPECKLNRLATP